VTLIVWTDWFLLKCGVCFCNNKTKCFLQASCTTYFHVASNGNADILFSLMMFKLSPQFPHNINIRVVCSAHLYICRIFTVSLKTKIIKSGTVIRLTDMEGSCGRNVHWLLTLQDQRRETIRNGVGPTRTSLRSGLISWHRRVICTPVMQSAANAAMPLCRTSAPSMTQKPITRLVLVLIQCRRNSNVILRYVGPHHEDGDVSITTCRLSDVHCHVRHQITFVLSYSKEN